MATSAAVVSTIVAIVISTVIAVFTAWRDGREDGEERTREHTMGNMAFHMHLVGYAGGEVTLGLQTLAANPPCEASVGKVEMVVVADQGASQPTRFSSVPGVGFRTDPEPEPDLNRTPCPAGLSYIEQAEFMAESSIVH
ncbi:hypothetical protein FB451DRAFT_1173318 [Mycena latifolia]|nr:hypothetical protein FB451DRAFT_1173318 [Mycena latifolia]